MNGLWLALQDTGTTGNAAFAIMKPDYSGPFIRRPTTDGTDLDTLPGTNAALRIVVDVQTAQLADCTPLLGQLLFQAHWPPPNSSRPRP